MRYGKMASEHSREYPHVSSANGKTYVRIRYSRALLYFVVGNIPRTKVPARQ